MKKPPRQEKRKRERSSRRRRKRRNDDEEKAKKQQRSEYLSVKGKQSVTSNQLITSHSKPSTLSMPSACFIFDYFFIFFGEQPGECLCKQRKACVGSEFSLDMENTTTIEEQQMKGDLGVERRSGNKVGYKAYNFQKDNLKTKDWIKMSRKLVLDCKAF
ncbi:hypothetical protein M8J76_007465 [Diaphorina citri]|nr:hypothetical protein M8J76_007465 [Diaphorina citri]